MLQDITKKILTGEVVVSEDKITCNNDKFEMSINFEANGYALCSIGPVLEMVMQFAPHTGEYTNAMTFGEFVKCVAFSTIGSESNIYRPDIIMLNIKNNISIEKFDEFINAGGYSLVYNQQQWVKWLNSPNEDVSTSSAKYIADSLAKKEESKEDDSEANLVYKNVNDLFGIEVDEKEISNLNDLVADYMLPNTYIKIEQFYVLYTKAHGLDYSQIPCVQFLEVFDYVEAKLKAKKDAYDDEIKAKAAIASSESPVCEDSK